MDVEKIFEETRIDSLIVQKIDHIGLDPWTTTVIRGKISSEPIKSGFGTGSIPSESIRKALEDLKENTND